MTMISRLNKYMNNMYPWLYLYLLYIDPPSSWRIFFLSPIKVKTDCKNLRIYSQNKKILKMSTMNVNLSDKFILDQNGSLYYIEDKFLYKNCSFDKELYNDTTFIPAGNSYIITTKRDIIDYVLKKFTDGTFKCAHNLNIDKCTDKECKIINNLINISTHCNNIPINNDSYARKIFSGYAYNFNSNNNKNIVISNNYYKAIGNCVNNIINSKSFNYYNSNAQNVNNYYTYINIDYINYEHICPTCQRRILNDDDINHRLFGIQNCIINKYRSKFTQNKVHQTLKFLVPIDISKLEDKDIKYLNRKVTQKINHYTNLEKFFTNIDCLIFNTIFTIEISINKLLKATYEKKDKNDVYMTINISKLRNGNVILSKLNIINSFDKRLMAYIGNYYCLNHNLQYCATYDFN